MSRPAVTLPVMDNRYRVIKVTEGYAVQMRLMDDEGWETIYTSPYLGEARFKCDRKNGA